MGKTIRNYDSDGMKRIKNIGKKKPKRTKVRFDPYEDEDEYYNYQYDDEYSEDNEIN